MTQPREPNRVRASAPPPVIGLFRRIQDRIQDGDWLRLRGRFRGRRGIVAFLPGQGRGEDADDAQVGLGPQKVCLVVVKDIDRAGGQWPDLPRGNVGDRPVAFDDVIGLDVVLVFQDLLAPGLADRVVQRIA